MKRGSASPTWIDAHGGARRSASGPAARSSVRLATVMDLAERRRSGRHRARSSARADEEHVLVGNARRCARSDARPGHRHRVGADRGGRAHLLATAKVFWKQFVQQHAQGARLGVARGVLTCWRSAARRSPSKSSPPATRKTWRTRRAAGRKQVGETRRARGGGNERASRPRAGAAGGEIELGAVAGRQDRRPRTGNSVWARSRSACPMRLAETRRVRG